MNLNYIPSVVIEGQKVVEILADDVAQDDVKWALSMVVYVVGNSPTIGAMERFIARQGNCTIKLVILYHTGRYFVVRFENEEERDTVLCLDPHCMMRRLVNMKP